MDITNPIQTYHFNSIPPDAYWHQLYLKNFFNHHQIQCNEGHSWQGENGWKVVYLAHKRTLYAIHSTMKPQPLLHHVTYIACNSNELHIKWAAKPLHEYHVIVKCPRQPIQAD